MGAFKQDRFEHGKLFELEGLSGAVTRHTAEHGIDAPVHDIVWPALHPYAGGAVD